MWLTTEIDGYLDQAQGGTFDHQLAERFLNLLLELTEWHRERSREYRTIASITSNFCKGKTDLDKVPFVPARLFKELELSSVEPVQVAKILKSSGTSGGRRSMIVLDKDTARRQSRVLASILSGVLGNSRLPLLILDTPESIGHGESVSARGAAVRGFMMFGRDIVFAYKKDLVFDREAVLNFVDLYRHQRVFVFGFTSLVWQFLADVKSFIGPVALAQSVLLHGGGWKKMEDKAVTPRVFRREVQEYLGISSVVNYYGMVEQTGSIFVGCSEDYLHVTPYSDVLIRNPISLEAAPNGHRGLIEVVSILPLSYPGHAILTDDEGTLIGDDGCVCGKSGRFFKVHGRAQHAEIRGCSDISRNG